MSLYFFCISVCNYVIAVASAMRVSTRINNIHYTASAFPCQWPRVREVLQIFGAQADIPAYRLELSYEGVVQGPQVYLSDLGGGGATIGTTEEKNVDVRVLDSRQVLAVYYDIPADTEPKDYSFTLLKYLQEWYNNKPEHFLEFVELILDIPGIPDPCTPNLHSTVFYRDTSLFEAALYYCVDSRIIHNIARRCASQAQQQQPRDFAIETDFLYLMFGEKKQNVGLDFVRFILSKSNLRSSDIEIGAKIYKMTKIKADDSFENGIEGKINVLQYIMDYFAFDSRDLCDLALDHFAHLRRNAAMQPLSSEFKKRRKLWPCGGRSTDWILRKKKKRGDTHRNKLKWSEGSETFMDANMAFQTLRSSPLQLCIGLVEEKVPGLHLDLKKSVEIFVKRTFPRSGECKYELFLTSGRIPLRRRTSLLHKYKRYESCRL